MSALPTGTVTFVFTDIEGSTKLAQETADVYRQIVEQHAGLIRTATSRFEGEVVSTEGDSFFLVFRSPKQAISAAMEFQRGFRDHRFPHGRPLLVRTGIHTGEGILGGQNYLGLDVNRAARICAAGHGGQVLISEATAALVGRDLSGDTSLRALGSHRLKDLAVPESIFQLVAPGLPSEFPPLRSADHRLTNLPTQLTNFVARPEVAEVVSSISGSRLLTLTGPGGTGKTRLALEAGAQVLGRFDDGVWFVPLAPISDPDLLTSAVAMALSIQPSSDDPDARLIEYLRGRRLLLILDNFEQILEAGTRVSTWLQGAPGLHVLVTSRGPLHISGEIEFAIPSLALPSESDLRHPESLRQFSSIELFEARAKGARPDFQLTNENAETIADIVQSVDGLPLAIELAASRVRLLSVEAVAERLGSRLGLLTGGARDLPERHRTLRSTIAWSYDLLDEDHRRFFRRLGVFVGGFAFEQADAVCAPDLSIDLLDGLSNLADQSLLRTGGPSESRFLMLATIREFALDELDRSGERDEIDRRHAQAFLQLAERAAPEYTKRQTRTWLDRVEADHDNLRTAIRWATEHEEGEIAQRISGALWRFWQMRGYLQEGRERTARALATAGGTAFSRMRAEEAAGGLAYWQADADDGRGHYEAALELARAGGDPFQIATALFNLSSVEAITQGPEAGFALADEGLELAQALGDPVLLGRLHFGKGAIYFMSEGAGVDYPNHALVEFSQAADYLEGTDSTFDIGWTDRMRGIILLRLGRYDEAESHLRAGMGQFIAAGDLSALPLHISDFARLSLVRGNDEEAIILTGAVANLQSVSETRLVDWVRNEIEGIDEAYERVGTERAEKLLAEGRSLSVPEILARVSFD
ncbi:MAG TPA: adenylate/guanylate cyclase domain-containing protein [Acidimicrobiia bacterium]|nr:adenylate/guanylate cyclase domain-containing protein [Acidimicrobiia bacterium]